MKKVAFISGANRDRIRNFQTIRSNWGKVILGSRDLDKEKML